MCFAHYSQKTQIAGELIGKSLNSGECLTIPNFWKNWNPRSRERKEMKTAEKRDGVQSEYESKGECPRRRVAQRKRKRSKSRTG
jgi:hypothetical protein